MIDRDTAYGIATAEIQKREVASGFELTVIGEDTVEIEKGWIFYWDSKRFVETGDFTDAIAGNAPLVIFRDGTVKQVPTAYSTPDDIVRFLSGEK